MKIFTKAFWSYAGERAIKTFAQTVIALVAVSGVADGLGFADFNWVSILSAAGLATVLSILTAITAYDGANTIEKVDDDTV